MDSDDVLHGRIGSIGRKYNWFLCLRNKRETHRQKYEQLRHPADPFV
jgi:hypothetical protein